MTAPDAYAIITGPGEGEYKDRGSKFLGFARPARTEAEALEIVEEYRKLHHKARHWCYAYRLGADDNRFRANDDGEPSGTGGRPILGQIDKRALSDTVVVVVRYYGGVKLGTSGLINAYREAASLALDAATPGARQLTHTIEVRFDYARMGDVMGALSALHLEMSDQDFGAQPKLTLELPRSEAREMARTLLARIGGVYRDEVNDDFALEGVEVEVLRG